MTALTTSAGTARYYLAGPMTGLPEHNYPAFHERAAAIRGMGLRVLSPAEIGPYERDPQTWEGWMRRSLYLLLRCTAVACLPGWEDSRGATLEVHIARQLKMPVVCATTLEPIEEAAHV